jgi:hypothetical protein
VAVAAGPRGTAQPKSKARQSVLIEIKREPKDANKETVLMRAATRFDCNLVEF